MKIIKGENSVKDYIQTTLMSLYKSQNLIPFIGAGFTRGEKAKRYHVLNAEETKNLMVNMTHLHCDELSVEELDSLDFQKVSNYFYKFVPRPDINKFLREYFTSVSLSKEKKEFISLNWPNIYTLNVDDAIEGNSPLVNVLPYHDYNRDVLMGRVFKLHGDAMHEITYRDNPNIIFSREQYVKSITANASMLSIVQEDYRYKNILFIGCSLDNELDLEFILRKDEIKDNSNKVDRIYLTSQELSFSKRSDLEDLGINTILMTPSYEFFYDTVNACFRHASFSEYSALDEYKNINIRFEKDLDFNKNFLIAAKNIGIKSNTIELPYFFSERSLTKEILSTYTKERVNIIIGRRLSGKSFLAIDIARRIANRDVYLFTSDISISTDEISSLFKLHNVVLIFDTNTISSEELRYIADNKEILEECNIHVIVFLNSSDRLLISIPNTMLSCSFFTLENIFDTNEFEGLNDKLSSIGLIKIKKNKTILDNIYSYKEQYTTGLSFELGRITETLTEIDLKILILSASSDKVYSSIYRHLKITENDLQKTIAKMSKGALIEVDYTESIESFQHAGFKTIVNSKDYLFRVLGSYVGVGNANVNKVASYIYDIVSKLLSDGRFYEFTKNLTLFDNLNQIFWKNDGGVINLIFKIYENLESVLYTDNQYWIQRAKSILYLKRNNEKELLKALTYAKKPYHDSKDYSNQQLMASFLISMIYGRLANLTEYRNASYLTESIEWYYRALQEFSYNKNYIMDFLLKAKKDKNRNDFYALCSYALRNPSTLGKREKEKVEYLANLLNQA